MIVEVVQGRTLLRFSGAGVAGWDTLGSAGLVGQFSNQTFRGKPVTGNYYSYQK